MASLGAGKKSERIILRSRAPVMGREEEGSWKPREEAQISGLVCREVKVKGD